jgi:KDO2-lipid IV(A) lauroyltransferase
MWKYYAFRIAGFTLAYLPKKVGYLIACLIADTIYMLSPALRAAIADNMRHVLGSEADDAVLKQHVRGVLRNVARNYFDLIKIPHMKLNDIESCITIHGWHNLESALKKGKGVILVTAHLGSFDIAAQILAVRAIKTTVLVESLEPPSLLSYITALRESNGIAFVPAQSGVMEVLIQSLRRGEVLLFACDRDIAKNGLKSNFFGEETLLPSVAVRIAMRTGAALVPAFNLRRWDGRYDVYCEPAINVIPAGNGTVAKNVEQVARVMEKYIRICPEQWVVLSPIWASKQ